MKNVLSSAAPSEPPTCWVALSVALAAPASCSGTPTRARLDSGTKIEAQAEAEQQLGREARGSRTWCARRSG